MDATENYQLKWHSFASHLHTSVANSLNSLAFTDVILYTLDGHQVPAHRFILSTCSQHLHQIFKNHPKITTTLPVVIVMPPELTYKTLTTLLQYMYCGETTVSKDILESVLRGGDILKVRGLWRPREGEDRAQEKRDENHRQKKVIKPYDNKKESERLRPDAKDQEKTKKQPKVVVSKAAELKEKSDATSASCSLAGSESSTEIPRKKSRRGEIVNTVTTEELVSNNSEDNFLVIKEEPLEWEEFNDVDLSESDLYQTEMTVKPEVVFRDEPRDSNEEEYSPLTCELCAETFTQPAEWVRHIQTHTDMQPARRQRRGRPSVDDENASFPPLQCDLCQQQFTTPAEWVRHIQSTHTEHELALSNNSNTIRNNRAYRMSGLAQKTCNVCTKSFPSHASMLIHRRTHTGEKPYTCELCQKGFNVKSNLLRHLRTLHDRIINSADVSDVKDNSNESQS